MNCNIKRFKFFNKRAKVCFLMLIKFGVWEPPLSNLPESSPFCFYIMSLISLESRVRLFHRDLEGLAVC